jgi:hypothetical protein
LERIDPVRAKAKAAEERKVARNAEMEATLRRARELSLDNNPFMQRQVAQFHEVRHQREAAARRREIEDYERRYISR